MIRTTIDKLIGTVIEFTDLGRLFSVPVFKGRIALDVRIQQGSLVIGKKLRLLGPDVEEELEIVGIEMGGNRPDPAVFRILCPGLKMLTLPKGKVEGWTITESE